MNQISNFVQVRADGKIVPSAMTVKEMLALGWGPSTVIVLRWNCDGKEVEIEKKNGIHGIVVPGANFVAAIYKEDDGMKESLTIFSPVGLLYKLFENSISSSGHKFNGTYEWFEPAMDAGINIFGVVFQTDDGNTLRCDINAEKKVVLKVISIRG